jgi:hypothetical protein
LSYGNGWPAYSKAQAGTPYTANNGVQINVNGVRNVREYFDFFIGGDVLQNSSGRRSLHASQYIASRNELKADPWARKWRDLGKEITLLLNGLVLSECVTRVS